MEQNIRDKIESALKSAIAEFRNDPDAIYKSENDKVKLRYSGREAVNAWKKNKICIYDGCTSLSIGSHTIQKSVSLKIISENSHVLTPEINENTGVLEMCSKGIGKASTFPGFCNHHENIFEEFENQKDLVKPEHFKLQIYRAICREVVMVSHNIEKLQEDTGKYIKYRDNKIGEFFTTQLGAQFISKNSISIKEFECKKLDLKENQARQAISDLKEHLKTIRSLKNAIINDIEKKKCQKTACVAVFIDAVFPVCIAGAGNFQIQMKNTVKDVTVIFNVLPYEKKTYLIFCALKKHTKELDYYIGGSKNPLQYISLIESCIVHGSDHWFIKPSVWNKIEMKRRNKILEDIQDFSKNIGHEYPYSIFDDLRKASIQLMDDNHNELSNELKCLLEKERKKLSC